MPWIGTGLTCGFPGVHHWDVCGNPKLSPSPYLVTLFTVLLNLILFLFQHFCHFHFLEATVIFLLQLDLLFPILGWGDRVKSGQQPGKPYKRGPSLGTDMGCGLFGPVEFPLVTSFSLLVVTNPSTPQLVWVEAPLLWVSPQDPHASGISGSKSKSNKPRNSPGQLQNPALCLGFQITLGKLGSP